MGAGASKPNDSTRHVFTSDTPVSFSPELVNSLQASSETNSSRAKSLDLHIAQRVHEELEKLQKQESSRLDAIRQKISSGEQESDKGKKSRIPGLLELPSISPRDLFGGGESEEEKNRKAQTSEKVQAEIDKLRKTLGERKKLRELPEEVDKARGEVIACLRINDRQPLNCWKEVEIFKQEVRKMEEKFVGDIL